MLRAPILLLLERPDEDYMRDNVHLRGDTTH